MSFGFVHFNWVLQLFLDFTQSFRAPPNIAVAPIKLKILPYQFQGRMRNQLYQTWGNSSCDPEPWGEWRGEEVRPKHQQVSESYTLPKSVEQSVKMGGGGIFIQSSWITAIKNWRFGCGISAVSIYNAIFLALHGWGPKSRVGLAVRVFCGTTTPSGDLLCLPGSPEKVRTLETATLGEQ